MLRYLISDPPKVLLKFGSNINTEEVVEDSDVYFDCIIDANPGVYKVEWNRNVSKHLFSIKSVFIIVNYFVIHIKSKINHIKKILKRLNHGI